MMTDTASLVACLLALPRPADAEEWLGVQSISDPPAVSDAYRQAVYDVLTALGVLKAGTHEVTSPMAYYFVQSLVALVRDAEREGHTLAGAWQGRPSQAQAGMGARLVNLLDTYRLGAISAPTPLRSISAVMSVIKARRGNEDVYLMQYDEKAEQFQPIGGKCEAFDASNEAALLRELSEELNLPPLTLGVDLKVHLLAGNQAEQKVSATLQLITQYDHSFYHLTDVKFPLHTDDQTRWLTSAELQAGRTSDGLAISPLISSLSMVDLALLPYSIVETVS